MMLDVNELKERLKWTLEMVAEAKCVLYQYEMRLENAVQELVFIKNKTDGFLSDLVAQLTGPNEFSFSVDGRRRVERKVEEST